MKLFIGRTYEHEGRRVTLISVNRDTKPQRAHILFQTDRTPRGGETVRIGEVSPRTLRPVRSFNPLGFLGRLLK